MPRLIRSVFLDTNVLVDYQLNRGPQAKACTELLTLCNQRDLLVMVCNPSLNNLFSLIENELKRLAREDDQNRLSPSDQPEETAAAAREIAWACVQHITDIAMVVDSSYAECREACLMRPLHDDFADNLIVASALHYGADLLVTSNLALQKHAPLACLSPADALVALKLQKR